MFMPRVNFLAHNRDRIALPFIYAQTPAPLNPSSFNLQTDALLKSCKLNSNHQFHFQTVPHTMIFKNALSSFLTDPNWP